MLLKKSLFRMIGIAVAACSLAGAAVGLTVTAVSEHNANVVVAASEQTFTIKEPTGVKLKIASSLSFKTDFSYYAGLTDSLGNDVSESEKTPNNKYPFASIKKSNSDESGVTYSVTMREDADIEFGFNIYYLIQDTDSIEAIEFTSETEGVTISSTTNQITIEVETWSPSPIIDCEIQAAQETVTLPTAVGYYFTTEQGGSQHVPTVSVEKGGNTDVYLHARDGYTLENATVTRSDGTVVQGEAVDGGATCKKYTLTNVNSDISLIVEGVARAPYTVTVENEHDGNFTFNGDKTVTAGSSYSFQVTANAGYTVTKVSYQIGDGEDVELASTTGTYFIPASQVTGNITITVELKDTEYTLTFPREPQGYKITKENGDTELKGPQTVKYGDFKIKVELLPGWTGTAAVHYTTSVVGALEPTSDGNGVWTIHVVGTGSIEITGISQARYTVTAPKQVEGNGYTYVATSSASGITYGSEFTFSITAKAGWKTDGYTVKAAVTGQPTQTVAVKENGTSESDTMRSYKIEKVESNITITITLKENAAIKPTINAQSGNYMILVKVNGQDDFEALNGGKTVNYGEKLEIKVEKVDGYTLGNVSITPTAHFNSDVYTIDSVTQNVRITVSVTENNLTVIYKESNGSQITSEVKKYSELAQQPLQVQSPVTQTHYTYFDAAWLLNNKPFTETQFTQAMIKDASVTCELFRTYQIKNSKVEELFEADQWYAKATADDDGQHYTIEVRMAVTTNTWKDFIEELEMVGGRLAAVGFSYSNFKTAKGDAQFYTESDITGYFDQMTSATGTDSGRIKSANREDSSTNRHLWLFGYKWTGSNDAIQNQKQTITGLSASAKRYVSHWFMVSIGNIQYVFQSERTKVEGLDAASVPQQNMLPMTHVLSIEDDEMPTIE